MVKEQGPTVSVVVATYNGAEFIREQIDTILAQSTPVDEIIITDDKSTDATIEICRSALHGTAHRILETDENLGFVRNFEKGIAHSSGDIIFLADQDDIWERDKVKRQCEILESSLAVHGNYSLINAEGDPIRGAAKSNSLIFSATKSFLYGNCVTGCTVAFRRELLDDLLPFPNDLAYHDWWIGIVAAGHGGLAYTDEPLIRYRQHESQHTGHFLVRGGAQSKSRSRLRLDAAADAIGRHAQNLRALLAASKELVPRGKVEEALGVLEAVEDGMRHGSLRSGPLWKWAETTVRRDRLRHLRRLRVFLHYKVAAALVGNENKATPD